MLTKRARLLFSQTGREKKSTPGTLNCAALYAADAVALFDVAEINFAVQL